jgi:hypothetical protein
MQYETPEITREREQRRGDFSTRIGELLGQLVSKTPGERLAWYRENRGDFFFTHGDLAERIRQINQAVPGRRNEVVAAADRLLRHEFDILGSGLVPLGEHIDWQRDFKSGIRWREDVIYPAWNWRQVDDLAGAEIYRGHFYSVDDASDLKVPWDLSSFFHFPVLGEAFLQTGDQRYAGELLNELQTWHEENPYPRGVNWTCAMVAGIRLANLMFALRLLEPEAFLGEFGVLSILRHLKFILDFFEVDQDGRRNNHYVNNLVGLGFGAVEIAHSPMGSELLDFAFEEMKREILTQFSEDGTNYEGTIPYQRFATESVIVTAIVMERNDLRMPPECRAELTRMLRFIDSYTKPNGLAPQVGDNDNGRILVLHDYAAQEYRDHRHILAVGAAWLGGDGLTSDLCRQGADAIWLTGQVSPAAVLKPSVVAGLYNCNGYALAKTEDCSLLLRCGRINAMSGGGHNHCDQLSFEFHDRAQDVIVDPGALIYSADSALRNRYRSTWAHNTLQLDDLEQQDFAARDLFAMQDRAAAAVDAWEVEGARVLFRGHHTAYSAAGWKVSRELRCDLSAGTLDVCDTIGLIAPAGQGKEFCGRLHLAAGVDVEQTAPAVFQLRAGSRRWNLRFAEGLAVGKVEGLVSPGYGVYLPAAVLEYRFAPAPGRTATFSLERAAI